MPSNQNSINFFFLFFIFFSWFEFSLARFYTINGTLYCYFNGQAQYNKLARQPMELYDSDFADPDDLLSRTFTNEFGNFKFIGGEIEIVNHVVPYIYIEHACHSHAEYPDCIIMGSYICPEYDQKEQEFVIQLGGPDEKACLVDRNHVGPQQPIGKKYCQNSKYYAFEVANVCQESVGIWGKRKRRQAAGFEPQLLFGRPPCLYN